MEEGKEYDRVLGPKRENILEIDASKKILLFCLILKSEN